MTNDVIRSLFEELKWTDLSIEGIHFDVEISSGFNSRDGATYEVDITARPVLFAGSMFRFICLMQMAQEAQYASVGIYSRAKLSDTQPPELYMSFKISAGNAALKKSLWEAARKTSTET